MREVFWWSWLALLFIAPARADEPLIDRIDIIDYGIFSVETKRHREASETATGQVNDVADPLLESATRTIPAKLGVHFGFRYVLTGRPSDGIASLQVKTIFPSPGLRNPDTQELKTESNSEWSRAFGKTRMNGYTFDHEWEIVPGVWKIQIWYHGQLLTEQEFTVVKE